MKANLAIGIVGSAAILVVGVLVGTRRAGSHPPVVRLVRPAPVLPKEVPALKAFIATNEKSKDPKVQDLVGASKIRIAYKKAEKRDFAGARDTLLQTVRTYRGTGAVSSDFGGVADQAAYQAAVCLVAEGRAAEGEKEFVRFIKDRPMSPLVTAAYRRIVRLHRGVSPAWAEVLLQSSLNVQQKRIAFEASVCGPKCIAAALPLLGKPAADYREIAARCGTTDRGTSCAGVRKGLLAYGVETFAYDLSAEEFGRITGPAILMRPNHFLLLEKIDGGVARVFDPSVGTSMDEPLPTDSKRPIPVILFSNPRS